MKNFKEAFAQFFDKPTENGFINVLRDHFGEENNFEFKSDYEEKSKLAKHIIAMANSSGGLINFGIEDKTFEPKGLSKLKDKSELLFCLEKYIPEILLVNIKIFDLVYPKSSKFIKVKGKSFQILKVCDDPKHLPFVSLKDGENISEYTIYVRKNVSSIKANYKDIQKLINRRLEIGYSSENEIILADHITQLDTLYSILEMYYLKNPLRQSYPILGHYYPLEKFDEFISRMIDEKKNVINSLIKSG